MRRATATIALIIFAVLGGVLLAPIETRAQETLIRVEWHPDPCQEIAVRVKETAGVTKLLKFRGHALSMRTFAYAVCEQVRGEIVDRIKKKVTKIRRGVEGEMLSRAEGLYDDFLDRLRDTVYAALPAVEKARIKPDEYFDRWLQNPNQEFELFVNFYLHEHAPRAAELLDKLNEETSTQILDGLQKLWAGAEEKLKKLDQVYDEVQKDPKPEYVEKYLDKYGLKGPWVEKLRGFEARFRLFDKGYGIVGCRADNA